MRVLIAGRNAEVLATIAGTFARDLKIKTATSKAVCLALLGAAEFDLVIACETLTDGSGLEVLSHVATSAPNCLRIFAARPSTLRMLEGELGLFGLFRTLTYPINMKRLAAAVRLACGSLEAEEPQDIVKVRQVVLDDEVPAGAKPGPSTSDKPQVSALKAIALRAASTAQVAAKRAGGAPAPARVTERRGGGQAPVADAGSTAKVARGAATPRVAAVRVATSAAANARIPETEAFKRALARRNAAKLEGGFSSDFNESSPLAGQQRRGTKSTGSRREPSVGSQSLAELARLSTVKRPSYLRRNASPGAGGSKRKVVFVGTGVFAALAAGVLTFTLLSANNSMAHSPMPVPAAASIARVLPEKAFPWQLANKPVVHTVASPQQMTAAAVCTPTDGDEPPEAFNRNPEEEMHPGPPQPNAPPPPAEPPSDDDPDNN
jgi:hypothetical protein